MIFIINTDTYLACKGEKTAINRHKMSTNDICAEEKFERVVKLFAV